MKNKKSTISEMLNILCGSLLKMSQDRSLIMDVNTFLYNTIRQLMLKIFPQVYNFYLPIVKNIDDKFKMKIDNISDLEYIKQLYFTTFI